MRKIWLAFFILAPLALLAQSASTRFPGAEPLSSKPWVKQRLLVGGGGVSQRDDFCKIFASEFTGSNFCVSGDGGTQTDAGLTFIGENTPITEAFKVCPDGPNCKLNLFQSLNGTNQALATAAATSPPGDFSCFFSGSRGAIAAAPAVLISKDEGGGGPRVFSLSLTSGAGALAATVYRTDVALTTVATGVMALENMVSVGFSYDFVTDGTSVLTLYNNGVASATTATAVGPLQAASSTYAIGRRGPAADYLLGIFNVAACSGSIWSSSTFNAMHATSTLMTYTSAVGLPQFTSRSTRAFCPSFPDNTDTHNTALGLSLPCIRRGGSKINPSRTNRALQSRTLANATWTKTNMTCTTTAISTSRLQNTASTCTSTAANGQAAQAIVSAAPHNSSVYLRRRTGTGSVFLTIDNFATTIDVTSSLSSTQWNRFTSLTNSTLYSAAVADPTFGIRLATSGDAVDVDFVQNETTRIATAPILTTTVAAARTNDSTQFDYPGTVANLNNWCFSVTVAPPDGATWADMGDELDNNGFGGGIFVNLSDATNVTPNSVWLSELTPDMSICLLDGTGAVFSCGSTPLAGISAGPHKFRLCNNGTSLTLRIDEALVITVAIAAPWTARPAFTCLGGFCDGFAASVATIFDFCFRDGQGTCP